jgi:hypothetical protein
VNSIPRRRSESCAARAPVFGCPNAGTAAAAKTMIAGQLDREIVRSIRIIHPFPSFLRESPGVQILRRTDETIRYRKRNVKTEIPATLYRERREMSLSQSNRVN